MDNFIRDCKKWFNQLVNSKLVKRLRKRAKNKDLKTWFKEEMKK